MRTHNILTFSPHVFVCAWILHPTKTEVIWIGDLSFKVSSESHWSQIVILWRIYINIHRGITSPRFRNGGLRSGNAKYLRSYNSCLQRWLLCWHSLIWLYMLYIVNPTRRCSYKFERRSLKVTEFGSVWKIEILYTII